MEKRLLGKVAQSLITWAERYGDPADREWIGAMRAELEVIDGGLAQLRWAVGVVPLFLRAYRADIVRVVLCVAAVVVANYSYPKLVTARPVELFFFAEQLYLPVVGMLAAHATRRVLAGTSAGIGVSLIGLAVLHLMGNGTANTTSLLANGVYVQILFFAIVGAAFGTLGATVVLRSSRQSLARA